MFRRDTLSGMHTRHRILLVAVGTGAAAVLAITWWRGHRRFGAGFVTRVIDPWLVRRGVVAKTGGEIGLIEHVGRRSGKVRISPVHPVPVDGGFRIVVPLGLESQWVRNVLAAGHCRIETNGVVYELDNPRLVLPSLVDGVPPIAGPVMDWLGFRYLELHRVTGAATGRVA